MFLTRPLVLASILFPFIFFSPFLSAKLSSNNTAERLTEIASDYEKAYFNWFPEQAANWGRKDAAMDRFSDYSLTGVYAWQKEEDNYLEQLLALPESEIKNSPQYITYQLLKQKLQSNKMARVCKDELWTVNQWGWHTQLASMAEKQPIGTARHRSDALKRWKTVDKIVDAEIHKFKVGIKEGFTAPKPAVERVIKQIHIMLNASIEESPFFDFARRDGNPQFKTQVADMIQKVINPSLQRYVSYLEKDYLPIARTTIGVSSLPSGVACYQAKILSKTTVKVDPQTIVDYGLMHMRELEDEVAHIGRQEFGTQDMKAAFKNAKSDPHNKFKDKKALLNYNEKALIRANAKLPEWFAELPKAKGIIKPYPLHRAQTGALGEYYPPCDDGSCPGIFYINTYEPQKRSRADQEATLFHELVPGHHLQFGLAHEDKKSHHLNKYLWNSGFGEGWALYAERLADEMGLYKDNISRLGMLSNEALRTARLVVDPGIHVMGWTRAQAVDYLKQHTALDDNIIEGEVDRYIMNPAQATAYMLGKREIELLRQLAQSTLKDKFNIREFHHQVLKNGAVTLPMLKVQIENWLKEAKQ